MLDKNGTYRERVNLLSDAKIGAPVALLTPSAQLVEPYRMQQARTLDQLARRGGKVETLKTLPHVTPLIGKV